MRACGKTDVGLRRHENQDTFAVEQGKKLLIAVVCDGMGGAEGGQIASSVAVETFMKEMRALIRADMTAEQLRELASFCVAKANTAVYQRALQDPAYQGMGTTLVSAFVQGRNASIMNVGDSRAYLFDGETLRQVSEDHSYVEEMRRLGRISAEDARTHPQKNLITRAVGVDATVDGDLFEVELRDTDILLLCSDGLTGMVEDEKIAEVLAKAGTLEDKGRELLTLALEGGGRDNITVALFTRGAKQEA